MTPKIKNNEPKVEYPTVLALITSFKEAIYKHQGKISVAEVIGALEATKFEIFEEQRVIKEGLEK